MKIEMGESLFYSWLRHIKGCQLVQTNWKASSKWARAHEAEMEELFHDAEEFYLEKYGYGVFKKNSSLAQIVQQGECDALGMKTANGVFHVYAVDVAFHEAGLNYGSKETTI